MSRSPRTNAAVCRDRDHDGCSRVLLRPGHRAGDVRPGGDLVPHSPKRELAQRCNQRHRAFGVTDEHRVGVCLPAVLEIAVEPCDPQGLVRTGESRGTVTRDLHVPRHVSSTKVGALTALRESLEPEFPQGLEQSIPRFVQVDQLHHGLVDEIGEQVCHVLRVVSDRADVFGRAEVETADERRKPREELLLGTASRVRTTTRACRGATGGAHRHPVGTRRARSCAGEAVPRAPTDPCCGDGPPRVRARAADRRAGGRSPRPRRRCPR